MVTLNPPRDMAPRGEIDRFRYDHPIFDQAAIDAQSRLTGNHGCNRTWYCGAWCEYGFHEDGLKTALRVIGDFGVEAPWPAVLYAASSTGVSCTGASIRWRTILSVQFST
jgi:predicted NAD/FAD-binding protein